MGFNEFIGKLFGNKNTRDMREIQPWVEKVKKAYITIEMLTNDELIVGQHLDGDVCLFYLFDPRLYLTHVACVLVAEQLSYKFVKSHIVILVFIFVLSS